LQILSGRKARWRYALRQLTRELYMDVRVPLLADTIQGRY
jgi:hypothetical protein